MQKKKKRKQFNIYPLKPRLLLIFGDAVAAAVFSVDNVKSEMRNEISNNKWELNVRCECIRVSVCIAIKWSQGTLFIY